MFPVSAATKARPHSMFKDAADSMQMAAIKRSIQKTKEGTPVLLEFITSKEVEVARPGT